MRRDFSIRYLLLFFGIVATGPVSYAGAGRFERIYDEGTGIVISLPLDLLVVQKDTKRGKNWSTTDHSINVDLLSFPKERSLKAVYDDLHKVRGRTLSQDQWLGEMFDLTGRDSDGSNFYVRGILTEMGVKCVSVVYSPKQGEAAQTIIQNGARTFEAAKGAELPAPKSKDDAAAGVGAINDPENFTRLIKDVEQLDAAGSFTEALPLAKRALDVAQGQHPVDEIKVARALNDMGRLRYIAGNYADAEPLLTQALETRRKALGPNHPDVAQSLTNIGQLFFAQGRYEEARPLLEQALAIRKASSADSPLLNEARNNVAAVYQALGRASDAKPLYEQIALPGDWLETPQRNSNPPARFGEPRAFARSEEPTVYYQVVPVFYGTDRKAEPENGRTTYGSDRGRRLELGRALVTVPRIHEVPQIERPWTLTIPYFKFVVYSAAEDPKEHFTLQEVKALPKEEFLSLVRARLANSSNYKNQALVFIHGFNTEFDASLFRAAQIAYDLGFDGAPFVYSWPSAGSVASYTYDRESAGQAQSYLRDFLNIVATETGATSVSVIAHSMGNQPLLEVLKDINAAKPNNVVLNQVILAAPDVDADNFRYIARSIAGVARGITLYAASNDRALIVSRNFWHNPRAGDVPGGGPLVVPGIDTIDVSATSTEIVGLHHSGYAQSRILLDDIGLLIKTGQHPPPRRTPGLVSMPADGGGEYWRYP